MAQPILIFAGTQAEAYAFASEMTAQGKMKGGYSVITEAFHLKNYERGSTLVMVGTWAAHPNLRRVEDEARKRGCPIQTSNAWIQNWRQQ